jgi:hypothetical protein
MLEFHWRRAELARAPSAVGGDELTGRRRGAHGDRGRARRFVAHGAREPPRFRPLPLPRAHQSASAGAAHAYQGDAATATTADHTRASGRAVAAVAHQTASPPQRRDTACAVFLRADGEPLDGAACSLDRARAPANEPAPAPPLFPQPCAGRGLERTSSPRLSAAVA